MINLTKGILIKEGWWIEVENDSVWSWKQVAKIFSNASEHGFSVNSKVLFVDGSTFILDLFSDFVVSEDDPTGTPNRIAVPEWHEYFLGIATAVAARAKCRRRQVGAVLVDTDHRILSTGYAGFPQGVTPDCMEGGCPRGLTKPGSIPPESPYEDPESPGYCPSIHAEQNALYYANTSTKGTTMYITAKPCPGCMKALAACGVALAVWPDGQVVPTHLYRQSR